MAKSKPTGEYKERDRQFRKITRLRAKHERAGNPVINVDTKKKEKLGNLYRDGQVYCLEAEAVYDHDYPHLAEGNLIPHGIYDLKHNDAMVNIGTSSDTAEFACESIELWWKQVGCHRYGGATSLLILADCGGSNSCHHYVFLESPEFLPGRDAEYIQSIKVLPLSNEFRKAMAVRVSQEKFREGIS